MRNKSFMGSRQTVTPDWWHIDATDLVVGRLAVQIANILRGKHKPTFTPHADTGDFIVVTNVEKIKFTGRKWEQKSYQTFTGYTNGLRIIPAIEMRDRKPEEILFQAVKRMVPRGKLGRAQLSKLKIFAGDSHPHQSQQPKELKLSL
ncbi:MAG: 50S ribosomal protein L13 [Zavarzinella sp.]